MIRRQLQVRLPAFALLPAFVVPLSGCSRGFFRASGTVNSDGGALGRWSATPDTCSRDPFDGFPEAQTRSLATFIWEYSPPRAEWRHRGQRHGLADRTPAGVPLRLEISRLPPGWTPRTPTGAEDLAAMRKPGPEADGPPLLLSLNTRSVAGEGWSNPSCRVLDFQTWEQPPGTAGGKPALGGYLRMDCEVAGGRVTANLRFSRCDY